MKRSFMVIALVLAMVLAFGGTAFASASVSIDFWGDDGSFQVRSNFEQPLRNYEQNFAPFGYTGGVVDFAKVDAASFVGEYDFSTSGSTLWTEYENGKAEWFSAIANNDEKFSQSYEPSYYQMRGILREGELSTAGSGYIQRLENYVGYSSSNVLVEASSVYSGKTFFGEADLMSANWPSTTYSKIDFSGVGEFGMSVSASETNQWGPGGVFGATNRGRIAFLPQVFAVSAEGSGTFKNTAFGGPSTLAYGTRTAFGGYVNTNITVDSLTADVRNTHANNMGFLAEYTFGEKLNGGGELWTNDYRYQSRTYVPAP